MFGAPSHHGQGTDAPMNTAAAIMSAMLDGKTPKELFELGSKMSVSTVIVDTIFFLDPHNGTTASHRAMLLPIAAARHGNLNFLRGLASQPDFFDVSVSSPSTGLLGQMEHGSELLSIGCACELLARGNLAGLALLDACAADRKASLAERAKLSPDNPRENFYVDMFLDLGQSGRQRERMLFWLASSAMTPPETLSAGLAWVRQRCGAELPNGPVRRGKRAQREGAEDDLLAEWGHRAFSSGRENSMLSAMALGYKPSQEQALTAADAGCFDIAASLYATQSAPSDTDVYPAPVAIAGDLANCLGSIAEGYWEERQKVKPSEWRSSTWGSFFNHREQIHRGASMALAGDFDSPFDKPAALAEGKLRLASMARALCASPLPKESLDAADIEALAPNAPATSDELIFLAAIGSPRLSALLASSPIEELAGDSLCSAMIKARAAEAENFRRLENRSRDSRLLALVGEKLGHVDHALFECSQRSSTLLSSAMRDKLRAFLEEQNLAIPFEQKALEIAAAPASRRRSPLKA